MRSQRATLLRKVDRPPESQLSREIWLHEITLGGAWVEGSCNRGGAEDEREGWQTGVFQARPTSRLEISRVRGSLGSMIEKTGLPGIFGRRAQSMQLEATEQESAILSRKKEEGSDAKSKQRPHSSQSQQ